MPDLPKKYRILGVVEEDILFEIKATSNIGVKSANLASVLDVRGLTYVSFPAFKFKSPELGREVGSHDTKDAGAPTLEITVEVT